MSTHTDDVALARHGDPRAFARLVQQHAGTVCAITTAILGDPQQGEEVGQEVFLLAWRGLTGLSDPARFAPWLRRIARNRAHDVRRREQRRREQPAGCALDDHPAQDPGPGEHLDAKRREAILSDSLEGLQPIHREVLVLFYRQGSSVRQVAEGLGLTEPTVRKRLSRARDHLRSDVEAALAVHLQRTAPGAGFLVAVGAALAALAPAPAAPATAAPATPAPATPTRSSARPPGRPGRAPGLGWRGLLVAGAAGSLLAVAVAWSSVPDTGARRAPRPAQTRAGQATLAALPPSTSALTRRGAVEPTPSGEPSIVKVYLGDQPLRGQPQILSFFSANAFFPALDEAPFPRSEEVQRVLQHVHETPHARVDAAWLEATRVWRSDVLPADPWAALITLEVEWSHAIEAGLDQPAPPARPRARAQRRGSVREPWHLTRLLRLTRDAQHRWPDHPIADYASLYQIGALSLKGSDTWDPAELADAAIAVLQGSDDPLVQQLVASQLGNTGVEAYLNGADLDLLATILPRIERPTVREALASVALASAIALDDAPRAATWVRHHQEGVEAFCAYAADLVQGTEESDRACTELRRKHDAASGWVVARGAAEPVSWQAALGAVVQRCAAQHSDPTEPRIGEGSLEAGAWSWSWSDTDPLTRCVATAPLEGPEPPDGATVRLEVIP